MLVDSREQSRVGEMIENNPSSVYLGRPSYTSRYSARC